MLNPARAGERAVMALTVRSVVARQLTLDLSITRDDAVLIVGEVSLSLP
jgi:hypothetical protein